MLYPSKLWCLLIFVNKDPKCMKVSKDLLPRVFMGLLSLYIFYIYS